VGEFQHRVCATVARAIETREKEACAQVCKDHVRRCLEMPDTQDNIHTAQYLAAAILARKETTDEP